MKLASWKIEDFWYTELKAKKNPIFFFENIFLCIFFSLSNTCRRECVYVHACELRSNNKKKLKIKKLVESFFFNQKVLTTKFIQSLLLCIRKLLKLRKKLLSQNFYFRIFLKSARIQLIVIDVNSFLNTVELYR